MKKILLILTLSLAFSLAWSQGESIADRPAQPSMVKTANLVGDFTITDSDGNTWNLYEQLALGKTIFLDLFYST